MDEVLLHARTILAATPTRWAELAGSVSPGLLSRRPLPDQWSTLDCLRHLVDTEPIFRARVGFFLAGQDFPGFDPDTQGTLPDITQPAAELAREFSRLRDESLSALAEVSQADLGRAVRHQELGLVTLEQMIHEWAAHDLNHTVQAERALMQPFIGGSGPWQPYFTDHVAKP
jgi:hypothetical protein